MSPGNQGVFQLIKKVTFRRILVFYDARKWGHFWGDQCAAQCALVGWWGSPDDLLLSEQIYGVP